MAGPRVPQSTSEGFKVEVIRSPRRKKTIQARRKGNTIVVRIPASMTAAEEQDAVARILESLDRKTTSRQISDDQLLARCRQLNQKYLSGQATIGSVRWVNNQNTRWGSCTTSTNDIRISDRLRHVPQYVLDSVLVHELIHTFIPGHGEDFRAWEKTYPQLERARGYLEAYSRWAS